MFHIPKCLIFISSVIALSIITYVMGLPRIHGVETEHCFQQTDKTYCLQKHYDGDLYLHTEQGTLPLIPYFKNSVFVTALDTMTPLQSVSRQGYRIVREKDAVLFITREYPVIALPLSLIPTLSPLIHTYFPTVDMTLSTNYTLTTEERFAALITLIALCVVIVGYHHQLYK